MRHLVWDWNGTLLDDLALTVEAANVTLVAAGGRPVSPDEHRRVFRRPITDYYADLLGRSISIEEFATFDLLFHETYHSGLTACPLAVDALDAVLAWGGTQSVLSMWRHDALSAELRRRGLIEHLVRVDGRRGDELGDLKAAYLDAHLAAIGMGGRDCVLVGDCVDDADAADAVGARCVLYAGGVTAEHRLRATGHPVTATLVEAVTVAASFE